MYIWVYMDVEGACVYFFNLRTCCNGVVANLDTFFLPLHVPDFK